MAKIILALIFLLLQITSFVVFAEELETLHHKPTTPLHPPTKSPVHKPLAKPPTHAPHHHHHHSPSHAPLPPPHPAKPLTHHHHQHQHHSPAPSPYHVPTPLQRPAKPPTLHHHQHPPAHAPTHMPRVSRSSIAVEGVVYVKSCHHAGFDTLKGATLLFGAVVKFQCHNAKYKFVLKAKTNKEGYIYIGSSKNISSYASGHCNVVLESAPNGLKPSNLHGGLTGAHPKSVKRIVSKGVSLIRYTVDPLAFEPKCNH
ncbi:pollen Ole e I family allergen [Medicago truncatula]|uniref:Pollen Ole e I family allergen n=1 Tax=Medicago truncatula TaxID=3880 RepID=G7KIE3_MEDTR|nr:pollen Ole e I family allergen [Medicago truncatula]